MSETPIVPKKRLLAYGAIILAASALATAVLASAPRKDGGVQALPQIDSEISGDLATGVGASTPPAEYGNLPTSSSDAISGPGSVEGAGEGTLDTSGVPVTFDQSLFAGPTTPVSNPTPQAGVTTPGSAPRTTAPTTAPRPVVTAPAASAPVETTSPQTAVTTPRPVTTQAPTPPPSTSGMPDPIGCVKASSDPVTGRNFPNSAPGVYELQTGWNCDFSIMDARPLLEYFKSQGWVQKSSGSGMGSADLYKGSDRVYYGPSFDKMPAGQALLILTIY
jgi:hypothetical protein